MTEPEPLQQLDRTCVRFRGQHLSYFSGCDYFRLASHPKVVAAVQAGLRRYGLNVAASRMTTGNHVLYRRLEQMTADFFAAEDALLVPSGYLTNLVAAQGLAGTVTHALLDAQAHPSLADAALLLKCTVRRFKSQDPVDLAAQVRRCGRAAKVILLTEGMFSRDGSVAPLGSYLRALPRDGLMLVDDAHGAGVLGASGKGSIEHEGVVRQQVIQTLTFSKAFGAYGGAILSGRWLRHRILDGSRLFIGSTPLPLPMANAALASLQTLKRDRQLRRRLFRNIGYVRARLIEAGLAVPQTPGPIVALAPANRQAGHRLKRQLFKARIYPPFIQYPGAPSGGYFRFVISSEHSQLQLDRLAEALLESAKLWRAS